MKTTRILIVILLSTSPPCGAFYAETAPSADSAKPKAEQKASKAFQDYYEALASGDLGRAKALTASFPEIPAEHLEKYTTRYSEGAKSGRLKLDLVRGSAKVLEDCAVVTFSDGKPKPGYDAAYLIRQGGKWKVFLKLTEWEHPWFRISAEQVAKFKTLEGWFNKERVRLYEAL